MEQYLRPNRSDIHVAVEEESRMEAETREHFDGLAPKRHSKPQRSDYSSAPYHDRVADADHIPEYVEFRRLELGLDQEKLVYSSAQAAEEFVETDYYNDLNRVDKQHHTTGTGFIKEEKMMHREEKEDEEEEEEESYGSDPCSGHGNPATNEWIPAAATSQNAQFSSLKPSRSDI